MTTSPRSSAVLLVVLGLALGACGDSDGPTASPSVSASAAPSSTSSPTALTGAAQDENGGKKGTKRSKVPKSRGPNATPTVRSDAGALPPGAPEKAAWQQRDEVEAVRAWAEAWARAINEDDLAVAARTMTPPGFEQFKRYAAADRGRYFPGPVPVSVRGIERDAKRADRAVVLACIWRRGWSQQSRDDRRVPQPLDVAAARLSLVEDAGRWLVEDLHGADFPCSAGGMRTERW